MDLELKVALIALEPMNKVLTLSVYCPHAWLRMGMVVEAFA